MATRKSLDLEPIITGLCYSKTETLTETEIRQAIAEAILNFGVEYVTTLPTGTNIKEKVYILPDTTQTTGNFGDIYVYDKTNTEWIHIDALKFNIDNYLLISNIVDDLTDTSTNKALSANQGKVLKSLVDSKAASDHSHGSISNDGKVGSTSGKPLITGTDGIIQAGSFGTTGGSFCEGNDSRLSDARAPTSHTHGNLQNDGSVGSSNNTNMNVVTDSNGKITTEAKLDISGKEDTSNKTQTVNSNSTTTQYPSAKAVNDAIEAIDVTSSLTNYVQKSSTNGLIKNNGTIDTNTYLTSQDISGKADSSDLSDLALRVSALENELDDLEDDLLG